MKYLCVECHKEKEGDKMFLAHPNGRGLCEECS